MENSIYIEIPCDLTSYEFYHNIIAQKNRIREDIWKNIILDFSETYRVEPLVIPNLLCMGYELKKIFHNTSYIYIPDISYSGKIKNYLHEIDFTKYAKKFELYDFLSSPYGGLEGKQIDPICGTLYFDAEDSIDYINRKVEECIIPFTDEYLYKFQSMRECEQGIYYVNEIAEFLEQIILNCKEHARSFSFTTLHANYSKKKIYISVSDYGCGFKETINDGKGCDDEIDAILRGVYKRKESKVYGLYNVVRRVLKFEGKVRIHSNNSQVIFTPKIYDAFVNNSLFESMGFRKYNLKRNIPFNGVHYRDRITIRAEEGSCIVLNMMTLALYQLMLILFFIWQKNIKKT